MTRAMLAGLVAALIGAPAFARQPGDATVSQPLGGAPVVGICLLAQQAVLLNAKVGVAADTRLKQLTQQAQTELNTERAAIESDTKAFDAQRASMKTADIQQRRSALAARTRALQEKAALRSREIEATRQKALGRISAEAQPIIAQAYQAHNCGLLIDRNAVLGGNMSGDLTADVVRGLDAKITTISFDREVLPVQPAH